MTSVTLWLLKTWNTEWSWKTLQAIKFHWEWKCSQELANDSTWAAKIGIFNSCACVVLAELLNCALFVGETFFLFWSCDAKKIFEGFQFSVQDTKRFSICVLRKITSFRKNVPFHFGQNNLYPVQELYPEKGVGTYLSIWAYLINYSSTTLSTKVKRKTMTLLHRFALYVFCFIFTLKQPKSKSTKICQQIIVRLQKYATLYILYPFMWNLKSNY